ncbi:dihydrolipoyl dehydrogenase [Limosilactobacillus coleohominis 101-4-CHN]|uniref:Dihydrolipoyl dehydrogenase n=1 Tax=Limosilactobacillus coleohominis 101-4-CHN TaxID=575594 RepID=C7XUK0_9LACO|nr:dihydrolipoyl dehydrogenase [Limosilactobacillus coleohominis]EEU30961.1 dihydrolipoyl dehydrogenase [Limosilactobacillus coleohominis 101-4-CHN]
MVVGDFPIDLDTVVIGSGPGGYVAAVHAAELGQKVTVIEENDQLGGVCLRVGCIPSKALIQVSHDYQTTLHSADEGVAASDVDLDWSKVQGYRGSVVQRMTNGVAYLFKKNKIDVIHGRAFLKDQHSLRVMKGDSAQTYTFKNLIIATGSHPIEIPGFKFNGRVIDSTGLLELQQQPKELVIIGGGYIGCELASAYANFGTHVTILEGTDAILRNYEKDVVKIAQTNLEKRGVTIVTNAMAKSAVDDGNGVTVTYTLNDKEETVNADNVCVAVGRRPNTKDIGLEQVGIQTDQRGLINVDAQGRTNINNIYAIGDIVAGAALAHKASYEGKVAAEAIAGQKSVVDYRAMPAVCYVDPEIATTGLTVAEAKDQGLDVKSAKFPFSANGRAVSMHAPDGFVRLVFTKDQSQIVGAQIVGADASDLISELTLAIESGATVEDVALTVHPHPSLSEAIMDSADVGLGMPTNI